MKNFETDLEPASSFFTDFYEKIMKDLNSVKKRCALLIILSIFLVLPLLSAAMQDDANRSSGSSSNEYTGSKSCRKCHERFYQLWAPSHHGLAMQPYTETFSRKNLTPQNKEISISQFRYIVDVADKNGWMIERGPQGEKRYRMDHVLGGKNVYYFLTTLDRGKLQTLPLAYDVHKREWFDMAKSGVRHFSNQTDEPIHWTDWQYTFNTACYGCHVSQLHTHYDLKTDTYHTTWKEPGINCETCHGPAEEHIRVCENAPKVTVPEDLKIERGGRDFTKAQNNAACASCHAKAVVLTSTFQPGDRFFDHFDLVTLEDPDFYPDGRDLGENYTATTWMMSPCVKSGQLDCLFCHTSSGRYRFKAADKANQACMPCHQDKVNRSAQHTHHKENSAGNRCISCHMPTTEFARMRRTDHSMLPPSPSATMAFGSPNACNLCHQEKTPQWADHWVRKWRKRDYQAEVLHRGGLIQAARAREWQKLPEMIEYVTRQDCDQIFAASLIRLMRHSGDSRLLPVLIQTSQDPSPLIRAASVDALQGFPTETAFRALVRATGDSYRLVRIRAAASLAGFPRFTLSDTEKRRVETATEEYLDSMMARPDLWSAHYNLGNYYLLRGNYKKAISAYDTALSKESRAVLAMVNKAIAYARLGDTQSAHEVLMKALRMEPQNAVVNFNLALAEAQANDLKDAEKHLRAAIKTDPQMAEAAYNLCVILAKDRMDEAISFCEKASELRPDQPRYAYTRAYYLQETGDLNGASEVLRQLLIKHPNYAGGYLLLGHIYEKQRKWQKARKIYKAGLSNESLPDDYRTQMRHRLKALKSAH